MTAARENPFWDFSLAVYARAGVAEACLFLQDRRGLDVNVLLYCCWAAGEGRMLEPSEIRRLTDALAEWNQSVLRPLRAVRRWLKARGAASADLVEPLREGIKAQELEGERIAQHLLREACPPTPRERSDRPAPELAAANLDAYLEAAGLTADEDDERALTTLLRGAFPDLSPQEAPGLIGRIRSASPPGAAGS